MKQYRVLIADDHTLARNAIRSLLEGDASFIIVGEALNGEDAYKCCEKLQPDLILMDINMPQCDGLEATHRIKLVFPHIIIVILSVSHDVANLFKAIQFGAQGYLLKNMQPDEWLSYLHTLLGEDTEISQEMAGRLFHRFRAGEVQDEPNPDILTARERNILAWIGAGKTNKQIAESLIITENTVKNHVKSILEKLYLENRVQLAAYSFRNGITLDSMY